MILLNDQRIIAPSNADADRSRRRFIDAHEIERTKSLLDWIGAVLAELQFCLIAAAKNAGKPTGLLQSAAASGSAA